MGASERMFIGGAIDTTARTMVLPPRERFLEVTSDEETNLARGEAVISKFLIVVQIGDDGLS